jgi:hypothetical protein
MALLKKKSEDSGVNAPAQDSNKAQEQQSTQGQPINRPHIDKKIDDYAAANPDYVTYLNNQSKERLVRMLLLEDLKAVEAKQNLRRGFHQFAVSNPALVEAIREIRATVPPEKQEEQIARLGKAFAIGTDKRVQPIRPSSTDQSGLKATQ